MYLDRDIDALMTRTKKRPIPSGRVEPRNALVFGVVLGAIAFVAALAHGESPCGSAVDARNPLLRLHLYDVAQAADAAEHRYRRGGRVGTAARRLGNRHRSSSASRPFCCFLIVFVWTPPHFWALALMKKDEYARVGIPMLPAVRGDAETKKQILIYSAALTAVTLALVPLHLMGVVYLACALALDAMFLAFAVWVARTGSRRSEGLMYRFSMLYLALLFVAMVVDRFGRGPGV